MIRIDETPTEVLMNASRRIAGCIDDGYFVSARLYVQEAEEAYKTLESEAGVLSCH